MGFPCCHVGSVMKSDSVMRRQFNDGFPLTSVQVFWRIEYYHYGMSNNQMHSTIKKTLRDLSMNDTTGVPCDEIQECDTYCVPEHVLQLFHSPAECRVLNYNDSLSAKSLREIQDQNNHVRMEGTSDVPAGLSQHSHFDDEDDDGDGTFGFVMDHDEPLDCHVYHSSKVLQSAFYETAEAIHNSNSKSKFEKEMLAFFNELAKSARSDCDSNQKRKGKRISMFPPNSKRKKTHGTKHMRQKYK